MMRDDELEKYLSEFRPLAVRRLERPRPAIAPWTKRLAVAAIVLICGSAGLWHAHHGHSSSSLATAPTIQIEVAVGTGRSNTFALTKLALEDEAQFEARLAAESRKVLPSFQGKSTLQVLSKE
jgi:hypothetical protein